MYEYLNKQIWLAGGYRYSSGLHEETININNGRLFTIWVVFSYRVFLLRKDFVIV